MAKLDKRKLELMLAPEEVGSFLRRLADGLDTGVLGISDVSVELAGYSQLRVAVDAENGICRVKLKVRHPKTESRLEYAEGVFVGGDARLAESETSGSPEPAAQGAKTGKMPDYDDLKERMDKDFKAMRETLEQGALPDPVQARRFVADSSLMTSYPGKGDEFYPEYDQAVQRFVTAMEHGGLQEVRDAVDVLRSLKKRCHDIYK